MRNDVVYLNLENKYLKFIAVTMLQLKVVVIVPVKDYPCYYYPGPLDNSSGFSTILHIKYEYIDLYLKQKTICKQNSLFCHFW